MKRLLSAVALCAALLIVEGIFLLDGASAKSDIAGAMLKLPAPPPFNPDLKRISYRNSGSAKDKAPSDDAPVSEMFEFWNAQDVDLRTLGYRPDMSDKTFEKLTDAVEKDPDKLTELLGAFKDEERAYEFVKKIYDREGSTGAFDREERKAIREWLVYHSPYFSDELARRARGTDDTETYVTNQEELLQLARFDFDRARPMIDQMYSRGRDKASRVLARWALYRRALDTNSLSDAERYRDELKEVVEDKTLPGPMRDLAMDALVSEKEWSGRDEWYMSLLGDETLHDLNGYTGLTTLIAVSPPDKYVDKMLELVRTGNPTVRAAAIRNLLLKLNSESQNEELIRAFIPWLEDPNWAKDTGNSRATIVQALRNVRIPESVPGLIKILDERGPQRRFATNAANAAANALAYAANAVANASRSTVNASSRAANVAVISDGDSETYAYRNDAIAALGKQEDPQAAGPLRRMLNEADIYMRGQVVQSLIKVRGFSLTEQVDALESLLKGERQASGNAANAMTNTANVMRPGPPSAAEVRQMLGSYLMYADDVSDELATAVVDRIEALDKRDPQLAGDMRKAVMRWHNAPISQLLMRDLKNDRATIDGVVKLLGSRKVLREKQAADVFDLRTGPPAAVGVAACLLEDQADYDAIIDGDNSELKGVLLACARLVRAQLPLPKVTELARGSDKRLAYAAELYLESEDSPEARAVVLGLHPGEARITGATTAFFPPDRVVEESEYLYLLFQSVENNETVFNGWMADQADDLIAIEKRLQEEVRKDDSLLGVYGYDRHYIRIYKDKAVYTWDEDDSRYRERTMDDSEFGYFKSYLAQNRVDEMKSYAQCGGEYCTAKELVMLSRSGGRRIYVSGDLPPFFVGLEKFFEDARKRPATVKYALSREIPGLELLLADEALHAETVWKEGSDLRVAVRDEVVRKRVEAEIDDAAEKAEGEVSETNEPLSDEAPDATAAIREKLAEKREFEGYSWRSVVNGAAAGAAAQPPGVEFIPAADGVSVPRTSEQWKARLGQVEVRAGEDALYKVTGGRAVKFKPGRFSDPLVTPNGRWIIARSRASEDGEDSGGTVRINFATGRVYKVEAEPYPQYKPVAWISSIGKVLLNTSYEYDGYEEGYVDGDRSDTVSADADPEMLRLLDPETGVMTPAPGEFRPLAQQTFRPLQKASVAGTFWAAMPSTENSSTSVGIYDIRNVSFRPVLTVPKIAFNSMSMWVDEAGNSVYFVYRGHLLKLPLRKG